MKRSEDLEGGAHELGLGLRPGHAFELRHALLVGDALGLEPDHQRLLRLGPLGAQDRHGVLRHRLGEREHLERVVGRLEIERRDRLDQVERQRMVEREVALQVWDLTAARVLPTRTMPAPRSERRAPRRPAAGGASAGLSWQRSIAVGAP